MQSLHNCKDLCKPWEKYYRESVLFLYYILPIPDTSPPYMLYSILTLYFRIFPPLSSSKSLAKPITQLACENACSTFYTFLANDFEERATFDPNVYDPSEEFPCTISWLSSRLPAVVPLGSIPREATRGGCRQASVIFSQCIRMHLTGGKSSGSLRGAGGSSGHASKLNQLANWRKASDLEGGGAANDPLL